MPKLTKNLLTLEQAKKLAPDYVDFIENNNFDLLCNKIIPLFNKLKKGEKVVGYSDGQYVLCTVSKVDSNSIYAIDGPVVRIGNGEYTWRVDGN